MNLVILLTHQVLQRLQLRSHLEFLSLTGLVLSSHSLQSLGKLPSYVLDLIQEKAICHVEFFNGLVLVEELLLALIVVFYSIWVFLQLVHLAFENGVEAHSLDVVCLLPLDPSLDQIKLLLKVLHLRVLLHQLCLKLLFLYLYLFSFSQQQRLQITVDPVRVF